MRHNGIVESIKHFPGNTSGELYMENIYEPIDVEDVLNVLKEMGMMEFEIEEVSMNMFEIMERDITNVEKAIVDLPEETKQKLKPLITKLSKTLEYVKKEKLN